MSVELSYLQLKTANDSRVADELQNERRKRSLLVLIGSFLEEEGFLDTLYALKKECGTFIGKYQVCDNIDLFTILQEYEAYYFVKFKKQPKIVKKVNGSAGAIASIPSRNSATSKSQIVYHLPPILTNKTRDVTDNDGSGLLNEDKKQLREKRRKMDSGKRKYNTSKDKLDKELCDNEQNESLGVEGTVCAMSSTSQKSKLANKKDNDKTIGDHSGGNVHLLQERLLKPLAGFTGYSSEMRELAAVISNDIYLKDPAVKWSDIIGLDTAKRLIKEAVVYPIKYPELFKGILSPWKGLLLYGPPGTGKTLLAKAVATECGTTFFNISASSIVSKWRGDSEKLVRVLFELARFHAPSTIFVDELESIMGQRSSGGGEHEGSRRMKTELLVQMDGLSRSNELVFLLAASNLPWDLDHAMLRRLEKRILVDLPTEPARRAMFVHHLPPVISSEPFRITSSIDYDAIAKKTEGYTGSDIFLVSKEAAMISVRKVFNQLETISDENGGYSDLGKISVAPISTLDVELAIANTKPSAKTLAGQYEKWQLNFESC